MSVSGSERRALEVLADWLTERGAKSRLDGRNLVAETGRASRPALLLEAHVDTVPAAPGWTRDPFGAAVEGDRLFGLGAGDNKASVAAMAAAFVALGRDPPPGRAIFAATCDEESGGEGLEKLRGRLPTLDAAVVSEPTALHVALAQRGLVRVTARATGRAAHASRPWQGVNALRLAHEDLGRILAIEFPRLHPLLGRATLEPTLISAGTASNVLPGECTFTLDGRPTPLHDNAEFERAIREAIRNSRIEVFVARKPPVVMPDDSAVARAFLAASGQPRPVALGGVSDLFWVRDIPSVVFGPGDPECSHTADESVSLAATRRAAEVYRAAAESTLSEMAR
ncbi:MAG: M20/M25/M40 family metallo-hydrolase [Planctomycetes bacterium]|nr:M20/M25/M40 family metallo-hydrolase [Planctomycetota bacterium]